MMDRKRAELVNEIYSAARRLGAKSDLLGLIGSWGDTLPEGDVLAGLQRWNRLHRGQPDEPVTIGDEGMGNISELLARRPVTAPPLDPATALEHAVFNEIYKAFRWLGAPSALLASLHSWGDAWGDADVLADVRSFNQQSDARAEPR